MHSSDKIAIYIHWPFCKAKCPYCDFNSHVNNEALDEDRWLSSYLNQIELYRDLLEAKEITSIFFGGGTPSLMPVKIFSSIIEKIISNFTVAENAEITFEANPTSSESKKFRDFRQAGANRISIGVQSLQTKALIFLGREHSEKEALATIELAACHFDNYSFDLIYGYVGQSLHEWHQELTQALALTPRHISLYQLTIEKGTKFYSRSNRGEVLTADQDLLAEMYEMTNEMTAAKNLQRYEISNYGVPSFESRHNLNYWRSGEYLGIGAGAFSRISRNDMMEELTAYHLPNKWLEEALNGKDALQNREAISLNNQIVDFVMMGMRLAEGVDLSLFQQRFGFDFVAKTKINREFFSIDGNYLKIINPMLYNKIACDLLDEYLEQ